jgi:hypothetical protein
MRRTTTATLWLVIVAGSFYGAWADEVDPSEREEIFRRAQVWLEPPVALERAQLDANPSNDFQKHQEVVCSFTPGPLGGNTPKFDCKLDSGDTIRVKYGRGNEEVYAEAAASRLLAALGFPTDDIYVVARVRCYGCPPDPFKSAGAGVPGDRSVEFDTVIIERPRKGRRIQTRKLEGWRWRELPKIDPAAGGASRAHVDALRLMAIFLSHWDNKPENQRLICLDDKCKRPLAMVHDLGGTFGPFKVDLKGWANRPVWADPSMCTVSMRGLPYDGSNFHDVQISEAGRVFLADRLRRLSDAQIEGLFAGARFDRGPGIDPEGRDIANWVRAFKAKRDAISNRSPCPATS